MPLLRALQRQLDLQHALHGRFAFHLLLLLLLLTGGMSWLLLPGLVPGDDIHFHLHRLEWLAEGLRLGAGARPVDTSVLGGAGYALGLFYSDVLLYPTALLRALGLPLVPLVKGLLLAVSLGSGASAFWCAWRLSRSPFGGLAAGLLYGWSSYLATDMLNRFALGETLAFPFVPLALLGWHECVRGEWRRFPLLAIGVSGVLLAHNLTAVQLCLALALLTALSCRRLWHEPRRLGALALAALLTLLWTACYVAPLLEQMLDQPFVVGTLGPRDLGWRAMPPHRLLVGSWLDTRPTGGGHVWMPPGLGLPLVAVTALGLLRRRRDPLLWTGLALTALSTTLFPWSATTVQRSFLASFQFPWRFLLLGTALLSVAGGVTLAATVGTSWVRQRRWLPWLVGACGVIWLSNVVQNECRTTWRVQSAARLDSPEAGTLHYLPAVLTEDAVRQRLPLGVVTLRGTTTGAVVETDPTGALTLRTTGGSGELELPRVAYLGYEAVDADGGRHPVGRSADGFLTVRVPAEPCRLRIRYAGTTLRRLVALVSLVSVALAALVWAVRRKPRTDTDMIAD